MLTCSKCGHHDQIEPVKTRWGRELHCHYCGNVAIEGVKAKWPIEEKPVVRENRTTAKTIMNELLEQVKPAIIELPLHDNQEDNMAKKECEVEGCTKKAWLGKRCKEHYEEKNGKWAPVKKYRKKGEAQEPAKKAEPKAPHTRRKPSAIDWPHLKPSAIEQAVTEGRITREKGARLQNELDTVAGIPATAEKDPSTLHITLDPEMLDRLAAVAKREYRTVEQQVACMINKALIMDNITHKFVSFVTDGTVGKAHDR